MAVINVSQEAHAAAKAAAESAEMGMGEWVSQHILAERTVTDLSWLEPLAEMALERSETPAETLKAALAALTAPLPAVVPERKILAVWADGLPPCKCDGESGAGPWHKDGCHRRVG